MNWDTCSLWLTFYKDVCLTARNPFPKLCTCWPVCLTSWEHSSELSERLYPALEFLVSPPELTALRLCLPHHPPPPSWQYWNGWWYHLIPGDFGKVLKFSFISYQGLCDRQISQWIWRASTVPATRRSTENGISSQFPHSFNEIWGRV